MTQEAIIDNTLLQTTASGPSPTVPKPTIAPTMECVVETGRPKRVAPTSSVAAAASDPYMPSSRSCGSPETALVSRMRLRTVSVT